jgi:hypothetical protein
MERVRERAREREKVGCTNRPKLQSEWPYCRYNLAECRSACSNDQIGKNRIGV